MPGRERRLWGGRGAAGAGPGRFRRHGLSTDVAVDAGNSRRAPPEVMGRSGPAVFPGAAQADGARAGGEQLGVEGPLPGVRTVP